MVREDEEAKAVTVAQTVVAKSAKETVDEAVVVRVVETDGIEWWKRRCERNWWR